MDSMTSIKLSGPARTSKIATLAKELMQAAGMADIWFTPHSPVWGDEQIAIRDNAFVEAQAQIEAEYGVPTWQPQSTADDNDLIDWGAEPRDGLRLALRERDSALALRDKAASVANRSAQRCAELDVSLLCYSDLESQVDAWRIQQARDDLNDEMPYALSSALRDRAIQTDKYDHATKAKLQFESELRQAERVLQAKQRVASMWAQRILVMHGELVATELVVVQTHADKLRASLDSLASCHFPAANGPAPVTHRLVEAINSTSAPPDPNAAAELKGRWMALHEALMADADAVLE
jgi:hypothetical protein